MLFLDQLTLQFGERVLCRGLSFMIRPHDRIGLVGSNGSGKTTLLRTLTGQHQPDGGIVRRANYVTVGYLPQEGISTRGRTLFAEAETAFGDILQLEQRLSEAQSALSALPPEDPDYTQTLEVLGELQHRYEEADAFRMKSKIERVLMGLGFSVRDFNRPTEQFSGGWQMRIELAKLLLREPSVLLLDEPTNHLDLDSLQWLEQYLRTYDGAVVLVSHDRTFLDTLTTRTLALRNGKAEEYAGNYSFFVRQSALRQEMQARVLKNQLKEVERTKEFIERFRYKATKARQVQTRIKRLEKMEIVRLEEREGEVEFAFPPPPHCGRIVLELREASKRYGAVRVFSGLHCTIKRGDRIAVVGVNGAGKSTFARLLAGIEALDQGERTVGEGVAISYFAQHQAEELDREKEALQIVEEVASGEIRKQLRNLLGAFLLHGDDVFKTVGVLSGGEKSRLALAKMLLRPANVLIMDEPTNHLDMRSKEVLQAALGSFSGTFLVVSHDRAFLEPLVNKVIEFRTGGMREFPGTMNEYLEKRQIEREEARAVEAPASRPAGERQSMKERRRMEAEIRQERSRRLKPLKEKLAVLEKNIGEMEQKKRDLERLFENPALFKSDSEAVSASAEYKQLLSSLEQSYRQWEETAALIDVPGGLDSP